MLQHALEDLLTKREFERISVGDIAEAATLNRATFYAHFVDKFDLLEDMVAARFNDLLMSRGVIFDGSCEAAIHNIALAVCDFLADVPYGSEQRQLAKYLEAAMVAIVRDMIDGGLREHPLKAGTDSEMVAATLAGAIYGAAKQWARTANRSRAEQAAASITKLLAPMMASQHA